VDPEGEDREAADPYVAAMAYELQERYPDAEIIVATTDCRDRLPGTYFPGHRLYQARDRNLG
jgi:hypothetical protein